MADETNANARTSHAPGDIEATCATLAKRALGEPVADAEWWAAVLSAIRTVRNVGPPEAERVAMLARSACAVSDKQTTAGAKAVEAHFQFRLANYADALSNAEAGLSLATAIGSEREASLCSTIAGSAAHRLGRYDDAIAWYEEALVAARRASEPRLAADALASHSLVARLRGDCQAALRMLDGAITLYEQLDDPAQIARCLLNRGIVLTKLSSLSAAQDDLLSALSQLKSTGLNHFLNSTKLALGRVYRLQGMHAEARAYFDTVLAEVSGTAQERTRVICLEYLGDLLVDAGQAKQAMAIYMDAWRSAHSFGEQSDLYLECSYRLAVAASLCADESVDSVALATRARGLAEIQGDAFETSSSLFALGSCLLLSGRIIEAEEALRACSEKAGSIGDRYTRAMASLSLSRIAHGSGNAIEATGFATEAKREFQAIGASRWVAEADTWITELVAQLATRLSAVERMSVSASRKPRPKFDATPIPGIPAFVTGNPRVRQILQTALKLSPRAISMLVLGETGTGKELVAEAIHLASERKGPFVAVNCGALPGDLLEAELFGHARGAYTGADRERGGLIEFSSQGTLFLDEIGDMPLKAQARLLRAIERGEVRRLGEVSPRLVDLRIVAATHRNLLEMVSGGEFRLDLYHRLSGFVITLPPLRERGTDVDLLVDHFLASYAKEQDKLMQLSPAVRELLARNAWPGNVRQLRNVIHRLVSLSEPGQTIHELPFELEGAEAPRSLPEALDAEERRRIVDALHASGWNKAKAAAALGASRTTLIAKMKRLRIEPPAIGARVR